MPTAVEQPHVAEGSPLRWVVTENRTRPAMRPTFSGRLVTGTEPDPDSEPVTVVHLVAFGSTEKAALYMAKHRT